MSNRLKMVAECVCECNFFIDVGTDHAYIPIYLYKKGIIKKAIASDISKGSIKKAEENIRKYNCSDFIETRCGNGFQVIKKSEKPDEAVISGMGGMLTVDIIQNSNDIVKNFKRLILQPQRDIDKVRNIIHKIGFKIIHEDMIFEDGKFYNIIVSEKGIDQKYSKSDYLFGKILIENKNPYLKEYIIFESHKMDNIIKSLSKFDFEKEENANIYNKFCKIQNKNNIYKEVLTCL